jgi:hypothetical protein
MTRSISEIRAAAYHEAGHAVASWRNGDGIGSVTIEPGVDADGDPYGGLFTLRLGGIRTMASGWGHRHLVMTLAGAAAQQVHDPRSGVLACAATDLRQARDTAFVMSSTREAAQALLLWALAEARGRVAADWHLIEVLAGALLDATTLTGEAATTLLAEAEQAHIATFAELRRTLGGDAAL